MAPRVQILWCALACAALSAAERSLADPASFVVVQGLNASRAANGVSEQATAEALAAVWETRVLATFKQ